jgi:hypothetical protein
MKTYGGVDVSTHVFLTSALFGGEWSASRPGRFAPGERAPGTLWVGPRTGLDDVERRKCLPITGLKFRPLDRPACSQSLYRLRYPGYISSQEKYFRYLKGNPVITINIYLIISSLQVSPFLLSKSESRFPSLSKIQCQT